MKQTKVAAPPATKSRGSATKTGTTKTSPPTKTTTGARSAAPAKTAAAGAGAQTTKRDPISHRRKPIAEATGATPTRTARARKGE